MKIKIGARTMARVHARTLWLRDEKGAAETSTILAWIVVGVLVVFALRAGLTTIRKQRDHLGTGGDQITKRDRRSPANP